jgi:hypothetical protein
LLNSREKAAYARQEGGQVPDELHKFKVIPAPAKDEGLEKPEPETPEPETPVVMITQASAEPAAEPIAIAKPKKGSSIAKFKIQNFEPGGTLVQTLITVLPHYKISEARDWVRIS